MTMKAANPKTQRYLEFWQNNLPIAGQMPIVFRAEKVEWHSLTCSCNRCEQDLPDEYVRGTVTSLIPSVVTVHAIGWCKRCNLLIPYNYRFRSTGAVEWEQNGRWVRSYGEPATWWGKLITRMRPLRMLWENLL